MPNLAYVYQCDGPPRPLLAAQALGVRPQWADLLRRGGQVRIASTVARLISYAASSPRLSFVTPLRIAAQPSGQNRPDSAVRVRFGNSDPDPGHPHAVHVY